MGCSLKFSIKGSEAIFATFLKFGLNSGSSEGGSCPNLIPLGRQS